MRSHAPGTSSIPAIRRRTAGPLALALACVLVDPASALAASHRFAVTATASLHATTAAVQSGGAYRLQAMLAAPAARPQVGGGYALAAHTGEQPLVCASDTIFEDGFDG